jgi:hypothetical protein
VGMRPSLLLADAAHGPVSALAVAPVKTLVRPR